MDKSIKKMLKLTSVLGVVAAVAACNQTTGRHHAHMADVKEVKAPLYKLTNDGTSDRLGEVKVTQTSNGVQVSVDVSGLMGGNYGFFVHEGTSCGPISPTGKRGRGMAAMDIYDVGKKSEFKAHRGDLPVLRINQDGKLKRTYVVEGLTAAEIKGRAVVIHDNLNGYSVRRDNSGRIACGVLN